MPKIKTDILSALGLLIAGRTALLEPEEEIMPLKKFFGIFLIHQIECNAKSVLAVIYNLRNS